MLTVERLRELLHYEPASGAWRWRQSRGGRVYAGRLAGCVKGRGYRYIAIDRRHYKASRLAFLYMTGSWPENEVDHIDRNKTNDRWSNLRDVTGAENLANRGGMFAKTA